MVTSTAATFYVNRLVKYLLTVPRRYSFVDLLSFFCLVFAMPLCASVYMCFVVSCWERADLVLSNCEFVTFPLVSWVRCGT